MYTKVNIPVWALCALINDDFSGFEDEDIDIIKTWQEEGGYNYVCCPEDDEVCTFDPYPIFGLASDVIPCRCC